MEKDYNSMELEELRKLKKQKYGNVDISEPKSQDEKDIERVIAAKFSQLNQEVIKKREDAKMKKDLEYNYNNPIKLDDVSLKEAIKIDKRSIIKFEWNGTFYKWVYTSHGSGGDLKVWKYPTEKDLMTNMFTTGVKEEIIYNTWNRDQTTDEGSFIEYSIMKWDKKSLFDELKKGTKVEEEHKQTFEDLYEHKIDVKEAIKETAEAHLKEDSSYYTKLEDMESDKYEGTNKGTGKLYEFFTPIPVVEKMWALAYNYGFKGGNILEPAIGSGRMLDFAPSGSTVTGFEINPENYKVAMDRLKKSEKFSNTWLYDKPFEISFLKPDRFNTLYKDKKPTWLDGYPFDLVIANPPYGKFTGLYKTYFKFNGQFEHFFIEYTMKLVKSGGLGIFIVPSSFMRNGNVYNEVKERIFKDNKLLDAYRLPSNIFEKTQIGTDIIVLQKK